MIDPRGYQTESVGALRDGVRAGHKRQLLVSPTGSGKTEMAMMLIQEAINKGSKTAFICDRLAILDQTSKRFDDNQIQHGVIQAGHWRFKPWEYAQICSAQTLARRGIMTDLKLIVVDEAHTNFKTTVAFLLAHPEIVTVGLTATPFTKGLGAIYSNIVNVTTTNKLVDEGFLSPVRIFAAKAIDVKGMRVKSTGEWDEEDMEKRGLEIVGDVIHEWTAKTNELFGGPVKTIVFSATVTHGEELCRQWQAAGHNFVQVSYKDGNNDTRRDLIEEFRKPDSSIMGMISCEALAKGFDVPDILCGVSCRPYRKSLSGHIQQMGRVMRTAPGKEFAVWLDHSGNALRFYDDTATFFESGLEALGSNHLDNAVRKEPEEKERSAILCGKCHAVLTAGCEICPFCGHPRPKRQNKIEHLPGEMRELILGKTGKPLAPFLQNKEEVWRQIVHYALETKHDVVRAEKFALAQYRNIYQQWPRHAMRNVEPMVCSQQVYNKIRQGIIAWARGRKAA